MNSDRFKGEPLNKISFSNEAIYYKGETPFCLISETTALKIETMDVIYALYNNIWICLLFNQYMFILLVLLYLCVWNKYLPDLNILKAKKSLKYKQNV